MEEIALIIFGIIGGIFILTCGVMRCYAWCEEPLPEERRTDRERNNRNNRNRNNTGTGIRHNIYQSSSNSHNNTQSSAAQSSNQQSPYIRYLLEQSKYGSSRTLPARPEPSQPEPVHPEPSRSGIIPSAPPLSMLSDQTGSDIMNRNFHEEGANLPPPSYKDLFPSDFRDRDSSRYK